MMADLARWEDCTPDQPVPLVHGCSITCICTHADLACRECSHLPHLSISHTRQGACRLAVLCGSRANAMISASVIKHTSQPLQLRLLQRRVARCTSSCWPPSRVCYDAPAPAAPSQTLGMRCSIFAMCRAHHARPYRGAPAMRAIDNISKEWNAASAAACPSFVAATAPAHRDYLLPRPRHARQQHPSACGQLAEVHMRRCRTSARRTGRSSRRSRPRA